MAKIFLSYRREDSAAAAGRIHDHLRAHFGPDAVFRDIDNIPFGVDFREHIDAAVGRSDVVLVVIGRHWAGGTDDHRRTDDPRDFVRIEVESALKRKIPVIPILIDHTKMPSEADLPPSLAELAFRNAIEVDQGRDFEHHVNRLVHGIDHHLQQANTARAERLSQSQEEATSLLRLQEPARAQSVNHSENEANSPRPGQIAGLDHVGAGDDSARQRLLTTLVEQGQVGGPKAAVVGRTRHAVELENRNRSAMIEKVRTIWITGYLRQSLFQETRIILGLNERSDAVARPMDLLVRRPNEDDKPLPSGTGIVDVFDSVDHSLLILGAPGSGKTTLLLELARDLLDRAVVADSHPIPVVFPLSTWTVTRKSLVEWLQDELNLRYDVPCGIASEWITTNQVLPLLDGLDEVRPEHRAACVEAINTFRQSHGFLPLIISSRKSDYESLAEPLRLHGAVLVRPLSRDQVIAYLADLGPAGEPVREALQQDASLWEFLDSPLLLNIVTVAFANKMIAPPQANGTTSERRNHLFGAYVNQALHRRAPDRRYTSDQTIRWLSWMASQMVEHGQTMFYLERLQIDWLPLGQRQAFRAYWPLAYGLVNGLVTGLGFGLVAGLLGGLINGLGFGLVVGLVVGLVAGLLGVRRGFLLDKDIVCAETVRWSWIVFRRGLFKSRWMLGGPANGLIVGWVVGQKFGLLNGLVAGLVAGLGFGLVVGLIRGMSVSEIETRAIPNQGIHRSARNALVFGLRFGLVNGLFGGLLGGLVGGVGFALVGGLVGGLVVALVVALRAGGEACLRHLVLRLLLVWNGTAPWNYVKFLDHAADRILLRKVGGGYMFIHRMLLEWFAARYVEPGTMPKKDPASGEHDPA
jgi:hypothetical protein